jgi:hypothetical protein
VHSGGGTNGYVCRWGPVPLAVGHDLACLLWNSRYMGSKLSLLCLFYNYAYMLSAMGAYEGGAHVPLLPRMPYWGGAARVPMRFYATLVNKLTLAPNSLLTRFQIVPQQTGISRVLPLNYFSPHLLGVGVWGASISTYTLHLGY